METNPSPHVSLEKMADSVGEKSSNSVSESVTNSTPDEAPVLGQEIQQYPSALVRWVIVIALLLGEFLIALDLTIVATAIPRITDEFESIEDVGWYGSAFFLTFAAYQSAWGKVYKYFEMRYAFFFSVFIFGVGTLICALAPRSVALIVGRAITGVGAAGVTNGVYTIIACIVVPRKVPMYLALVGMDFSIASVAGPLLGGVLTEKLSWRWCFWISLPVAGASLFVVLVFFRAPDSMKPTAATPREKFLQMDFQGTLLIMASLLCYMLALQYGGTSQSWNSGTVVALLVLWIVLAIAFGAEQWYQQERAQMVPRIMTDRTIIGLSAFIVLINGTIFLMIYYLPIYFQAIGGSSPAESGVQCVPLILAMSIALLISSAVVTRIGYFHPLMLIGGVCITVGSGLIYTLDMDSTSGQYIGYQILTGFGNGICSQIPLIASIAFSKVQDIPLTTAMVLFYQLISGALSVSLAQTLFTNILIQKLPIYAPTVDPARVIAAGASELRSAFSAEELPGVLQAYMAGIKASWAAGIAMGALSVFVALIPPVRSIHAGNNSGAAVPAA